MGATSGKVRALINDKGGNMKSAGPATPVEIIGLGEVPAPGDLLTAFKTDREARDYAEKFQQEQQEAQKGRILSLEDFSKEVKKGERKDLNLILKTDVNGSLEAIAGMVSGLNTSGVRLNIIHQGVGTINENDIVLAQASGAIVIGFHVTADGNAAAAAEKAGVNIRIYDIIYKITEDLKLAADGLLEPVYEEVQLGEAEVRATYKFSKVGVIAGAFVTSGKMVRGAKMRIFRGGEKIYEGKLEALKRFKDDVREVETNFECGISVQGYEDFAVGDKIQAFEMRKKDPMAGAK